MTAKGIGELLTEHSLLALPTDHYRRPLCSDVRHMISHGGSA